MSLDLYLVEVVQKEDEVYSRNITHNVQPMWTKAGVHEALYESDGRRAGDLVEVLERGLEHMLDNFDEYEKLDSPNGWGRARHAIGFLYFTLKAFRANPNAFIRVSK